MPQQLQAVQQLDANAESLFSEQEQPDEGTIFALDCFKTFDSSGISKDECL